MATIKKGTYILSSNPSYLNYDVLQLPTTINGDDFIDNYGFEITPMSTGNSLGTEVVAFSIFNTFSYNGGYSSGAFVRMSADGSSLTLLMPTENLSNIYGGEFEIPKDTTVNDVVYNWFNENTTSEGGSSDTPTAESVKAKIQSLINKANTTTGKSDTDLTEAVLSLVGGYGNGDSPLPSEVATESEMTALLETAEVGSVYKYTGTSGTYENGALYVVEESE